MKVTTFATNTLLVGVLVFCTTLEDVRARSKNVKGVYFDENTSKLIPTDNQVVQSLADLSDGVYSLGLTTTRSGCGSSGQGVCLISNYVFCLDDTLQSKCFAFHTYGNILVSRTSEQ
jgi:hypothetical protein